MLSHRQTINSNHQCRRYCQQQKANIHTPEGKKKHERKEGKQCKNRKKKRHVQDVGIDTTNVRYGKIWKSKKECFDMLYVDLGVIPFVACRDLLLIIETFFC